MRSPPGFVDLPVGQLSVDELRRAAVNAGYSLLGTAKCPVEHGDGMPAQVDALALDGAADPGRHGPMPATRSACCGQAGLPITGPGRYVRCRGQRPR